MDRNPGKLKPGDEAPEFALPDSSGAIRKLSDLVEASPLVLIFYRGHW